MSSDPISPPDLGRSTDGTRGPNAPGNETSQAAPGSRDQPGDTGSQAKHGTQDGLRLRPWQIQALEQFESSRSTNFLAVATPGGGKTAFALTAARRALVARSIRRVVIVVPTQHLKHQWAHAAEQFDIHLDPEWTVGYGGLPSDVHGVVVTYQQVSISPATFGPMVRDALVVLDEVHHAGDSRSWGDGVRQAFEPAWRRLCLSGTPFRSDQITIPFIRYDGDLAHPDYEYGYGDALKDGKVVRPVYFPRINGRMEWTAPDGADYEATFDDRLTRDLASQRLRTALGVSGEWLPTVLAQAHAQLMHLRTQDPNAAGLAIAIDQEHAKWIAALLQERLGITPTIATSDDPDASEKISRFSDGVAPWIVAVRMVSEGVDIPRLRVGVYATNTITELFFRQAVGRLVRWNARLRRQAAYMFIPDDIRLRTFGLAIAEQRRHNLHKLEKDDDRPQMDPAANRQEKASDPFEQLNLFAAISAVPLDEHGRPLSEARVYGADNDTDNHAAGEDEIPDLVDVSRGATTELSTPSRFAGHMPMPAPVPAPERDPHISRLPTTQKDSALVRRRQLREANSEAVRDVVHLTGKTHADVNNGLNRKVGIRRISLATVKQLEQRLTLAKSMMRRR